MTAQTGTACGGRYGTAGFNQSLDISCRHGVQHNLLGGRKHDAAYTLCHFASLENFGGLFDILQPAIGAGADDHLLDGHALHLVHGAGVGRQMWQSHGRTQLVQVNDHLALVHGVGVRLKGLPRPGDPAIEVGSGHIVHGKNSVFAACLDSHVGNGEAVIHGQLLHTLAAKLQRLVQGAVHTDFTDKVEHHIFAGHIRPELSLQGDLDGGGHLEPGQSSGHSRSHIGRAYASGKSAQGTVGAGVGVSADDGLTGGDQALLGQQGMLHAHLAHVIEVGNVKALGKLSGLGAQLGRLNVLAGGGVVQHNGDLVLIKNLG